MTIISFTVAGTPKPKGSLKHVGDGRMVEQVKGSKEWRNTVAWAARQALHGAAPLTGPVIVHAIVYIPRPKTNRDPYPITRSSGDDDKHSRNILDALADAGVYRDDSQVVDLFIRKRFADTIAPGAHISVQPIREDHPHD